MLTLNAVAALLALAQAPGFAPQRVDPLREHLAAWVHRCEFVGFVRPVEASEMMLLDIVEPHGKTITLLGPGGTPIPPNKEGEIPLGKRSFWNIRCEVERVVKGPVLSEIEALTYAIEPREGMSPRPLPRKLEAGKSVLVFLIKPDEQARIDLRESWNYISEGGYHAGICHVVRVQPGVWGLLNTEYGSFYVLDTPAGGWPKAEGPPLRSLMECLLAGLSSAKTSASSAAFLDLLELASPGKFDDEFGGMLEAEQRVLRAAALWPEYESYWATRIVPALREWVDKQTDENDALRGLVVALDLPMMVKRDPPSRELAEQFFQKVLALAREGRNGYTKGLGAVVGFLAPDDLERLWLQLLDTGFPAPHWVMCALGPLSKCGTERCIPSVKRALREEYETAPIKQRHSIHRLAMLTLARVLDDPEHAPPKLYRLDDPGDDEMWKPGGRLAELLEYWRNKP